MHMNTQFKKGVIEMCVLSLVTAKDRYGYELIEAISKQIEISEGAIYPILRRLSKEGYFETYLEESSSGPPRKYYRITNQGKKAALEMSKDWNTFTEQVNQVLKSEES